MDKQPNWQQIENEMRHMRTEAPPADEFWTKFRRRAEGEARDLQPKQEGIPASEPIVPWQWVAGVAAALVLLLAIGTAYLPSETPPPIDANVGGHLQVVAVTPVAPGQSGVKHLELRQGSGAVVLADARGDGAVLWVPDLKLKEKRQ